MKIFYSFLFVLIVALTSGISAKAQTDLGYIQSDLTLATGTYTCVGIAPGYNITIPAGETVTLSGLIYTSGNLSVSGNLTITEILHVNGILTISTNAVLIVNGDLTTGTTLTLSKNSTLSVSGDYLSNGNATSAALSVGSSAVLNVTGLVSANAGFIKVDRKGRINTGNINFERPNNIISGSIYCAGTATFNNVPTTFSCPDGQLYTQNLVNLAAPDAIVGAGYISVTGNYTGINRLTLSPLIVLNATITAENNPGSATIGDASLACNGVLQVEMISFNVRSDGKSVQLNWSATSEINNKGFEVQRSIDGKNFSRIAFVKSNANFSSTNSVENYSYDDFNAVNGINYYRLMQVNQNENYSYSDIKKITLGLPGKITLYPNPTSNSFYIDGIEDGSQLRVFDAVGKLIINKNLINDHHKVDLDGFAKGSYFLIVTDKNQQTTKHSIIKK